MKHLNILLLAAFFLGGCATFPSLPSVPPNSGVVLSHSESRVGTYVSGGRGFYTSSHWIEGPEGLILIDTQFLPSAAEEFIQWAELATGKKAVLAIVLHPNPDKFNGTGVFRKHGIKVITSEQVREQIPSVHRLRLEWFHEQYKPDYPESVTLPESFGPVTTEIRAGGVTVKAHVLGAGCSRAHVVVEYLGHVFPGDLVTNDFHSWLELGMLGDWVNRIQEMKDLKPKFIHPGRGASGTAELLDQQEAYLKRVIRIVMNEKPWKHSKVDPEILTKIQTKIEEAYPGYRFPKFIEKGLEAMWKNMAARSTSFPVHQK